MKSSKVIQKMKIRSLKTGIKRINNRKEKKKIKKKELRRKNFSLKPMF